MTVFEAEPFRPSDETALRQFMLLVLSPQGAAMKNPEPPEFAELDDFFRRGEQLFATAESLEPPMGTDVDERSANDEPQTLIVRTPEQIARRQRFIRYVSMTMGGLALGLALVFSHQALARKSRSTIDAPVAATHVAPVDSDVAAAKVDIVSNELKPTTATPVSSVSTVTQPTVVVRDPSDNKKHPTLTPSAAKLTPQAVATKKVAARARSTRTQLAARTVATTGSKPRDYKPPTASFAD